VNLRGAQILVVEDDPSISLGLRMNLEREGYVVELADDGERGLAMARDGRWDLLIVDVMLPKTNGYELLAALRAEQDHTPVLMLSARSAEVDKIMGLDLGAEDYVTKPFSIGELLARVRVLLRRRNDREKPGERFEFGGIVADASTRLVERDGEPVELTTTEFEVLAALARARGRILTRRQIMDAVWGRDHHGTERTVDNFLAQLRAKLEVDPTEPKHFLTVRGVGYRLAE
jgi:DNA-binding response OmpR family regulator